MIQGKKPTVIALRLCAVFATGLILRSQAPPEGLQAIADLAWIFYAASTVALLLISKEVYSHPRFNPIYVATEFALLGLFFAVYRGAAWSFYPLFLLTILLAALSRRVVMAMVLGLAVAFVHALLNLGAIESWLGGSHTTESSILILQSAILLTTSGVVGFLTEELDRQESSSELFDSALEVSSLLTGGLDLTTVYLRVTGVLAKLFRAGRVAVIEVDRRKSEGRILAAIDRGERVGELTIDIARYPEIQECLSRFETVIVGSNHPALSKVRNKRLKHATMLVTPIMVNQKPRGVIFVRIEDHRSGFSLREVNFCKLMASATAHAIAQVEHLAEVERAAYVDSLTGLHNLRSFHGRLEEEMERAERTRQDLTVLMIDVDYLSRINDAYGHLTGDEVLRTVADCIRDEVRDIDHVARYGGEEFAVLLVSTDAWRAQAVAERIRSQVQKAEVHEVGLVTVSIGIAAYPQDGSTPRELVHRADQALYFAKYQGRNRSTTFDSLHHERDREGMDRAFLEAFTSVSLERHFNHDDPRIRILCERLVGFADSKQVVERLDDVITSLTIAMQAKDSYTKEHLEAAAALAKLFLARLPIDDEQRRAIWIACLLHDIGKLGIREDILEKTEFLTRDEYQIVRQHPLIGARILEPLRAFHSVVPYIRNHHERWDGKGYPDGLAGEDIPYGARVVCLIDAFHAMISRRPYYQRMKGLGYACEEIRRNLGSQFDPNLGQIFLETVEEHRTIVDRFVAHDEEHEPEAPVEQLTDLTGIQAMVHSDSQGVTALAASAPSGES